MNAHYTMLIHWNTLFHELEIPDILSKSYGFIIQKYERRNMKAIMVNLNEKKT